MRPAPTRRPHPHAPAIAALAILLASCGAAERGRQPPQLPSHLPIAHTVKPLRAAGATIKTITPANGSQQPTTFTARVTVHGFILQGPRAGTTPRADHGHLHFILDGGRYDQPQYSGANGRQALRLAVNGYYSPAYQPIITYTHIPPGHHTLQAELVNRNEAPTGISTTTHFTSR